MECCTSEDTGPEKLSGPDVRRRETDLNKRALKKGWELFFFFFKTGCFTFGGGWSILAQMERQYVEKEKIITKEELLELAAVGKSIPGIMITNISMLFGYQVCGWFGGICAVLGITCPAVLILTVITLCYEQFKANYWCQCILEGIQASVVPIIGSAALSLGKDVLKTKKGFAVTAAALGLCIFTGISNIAIVLMGALAALVWRGVKKHGVS